MPTTQRPPFVARIVTLAGGALARITAIRSTDIGYELVELIAASEPADYRITRPALSAAPVVGWDFATAEDWPTDAELVAAIDNPPVRVATPADIAAHRYGIENGGVAVAVSTGPHRFDTTRENRSMWLALQLMAQANPALTQGWKTLDHGFVVLTNADILTVTAAVYAHIATCFAKEAALLAAPPALADLPAAFAAA